MASLSIALWLAGASPSAPNLERIRLLPAAPAAGEGGWTLEERMRHYNVPGVSVAVFANDQVLWAEGYGLADREANAGVTPQTPFQAGSISKPVTAAAVLREVDAGRLKLDRDVNEYLKSWKLPDSEFTAQPRSKASATPTRRWRRPASGPRRRTSAASRSRSADRCGASLGACSRRQRPAG